VAWLCTMIRQVNEMNKTQYFLINIKKNSCKRCDVLVVEMMLPLCRYGKNKK
jgi:hypothetical protein